MLTKLKEHIVFKKIVNSLDIEKSKLINNTSKIEDASKQLEKCMKCNVKKRK